jgi:hypothetical protein
MRVLKILNGIRRSFDESCIKLLASPFDAMFDLIGEISQSTHRDGIFWRVLRVAIALSLMRNNHLGVCLCSKGSRFKKRLFVPDTLAINI